LIESRCGARREDRPKKPIRRRPHGKEDRVSKNEAFSNLCRRVCQEQGWELRPSGVHVDLSDGRHQVVELEVFQHEQDELVRFFTTIGKTENLTPVRLTIALRINCELAHGAFAVKNDNLVMVETLMLEDADPSEIEASIRYLAETADYYEKAIFEQDVH
jgi:hypothetical protein